MVLQHSHVIKKENNVLNELLDVLHLRETQLTSDTSKIQDQIDRNLLTISKHTKLIQPSLTNQNSELNPKVLKVNNKKKVPQKLPTKQSSNSKVKDLIEEFKFLKKMKKKTKETIAEDSDLKKFNANIKAYVDVCCLSRETVSYFSIYFKVELNVEAQIISSISASIRT